MDCWNEQTLHWAIRRLLETGADPRSVLAGDSALGKESPRELRDVMTHLMNCPFCLQTARDLLEFELAWNAGDAVVTVLPLEEIRPKGLSLSRDEEREAPEYAVAADAGPPRETLPLDGHTAISLSTKDGRFLVRIFRDEKGGGATAVLLRNESVAPAGDPPAPQFSLSVDGTDYPFDGAGIAQLPVFPGTPPCLVVNQSQT